MQKVFSIGRSENKEKHTNGREGGKEGWEGGEKLIPIVGGELLTINKTGTTKRREASRGTRKPNIYLV